MGDYIKVDGQWQPVYGIMDTLGYRPYMYHMTLQLFKLHVKLSKGVPVSHIQLYMTPSRECDNHFQVMTVDKMVVCHMRN